MCCINVLNWKGNNHLQRNESKFFITSYLRINNVWDGLLSFMSRIQGSITTYYLHIIADSTKSVENQILKVTAETRLSFEAELKEITGRTLLFLHVDMFQEVITLNPLHTRG